MKNTLALAALGVVIFVALAATSAVQKSATVDEYAHLAVGLYACNTGDFGLYGKTPPVGRMLATSPALLFRPAVPTDLSRLRGEAWLPWTYATWFQLENRDDYDRLLRVARQSVILMGAVICLLVFFASRSCYGDLGGLISLAAAVLSPTLLAHSQLVTTDVPAALFCFIFLLLALHYIRAPRPITLVLMTLAAAGAALSKFSLLFLVPFLALAPLGAYLWRRRLERRKEESGPPVPGGLAFAHLVVIAIIFWFAIFAGYMGKHVGPYPEPLRSKSLAAVETLVKLTPLPREFVRGLDLQLADAEHGEWRSGSYLLGHWYAGGHWYYYLVALAAKEPVPYLLAGLAALFLILRRPRFDEVALLCFAALYFFTASVFGSLQIGIRYLLPIYPIGFLLLGRLGEYASAKSPASAQWRRSAALMLAVAGVWALGVNIRIWPDYLAYFSPVVGGPDRGRNVLLDSNLDWGQDLPGLARWMRDHQVNTIDLAYFGHDNPRRFGINFSLPARNSGNRYLAISANFLMGRDYPMTFVSEPLTKQDPLWIVAASYRDKKPAAIIGHSIYIFDQGGP